MAKKKKVSSRGGFREGAGRPLANPEDGKTIPVTVRVPGSLVEQADKLADSRGQNRSAFFTEAIRAAVGE